MFVAEISAPGPTAVRFILLYIKVNSQFWINHVLKLLFRMDIPQLYGRDAKRVAVHHNSAPAHKALPSVQWMDG
jgi:hypothetical protein